MAYKNLFLMTIVSFISMYVLMYMMVDSFAHVYPNLNQLYMAGLMTVPMVIIELIVMRMMYQNTKLNIIILITSLISFVVLIMFVRKQTAITDKEFLKSMIPHHAAALLMCKKGALQDPDIQSLCKNIISTQQSEINFMKSKLDAISGKK